ncbi:MAG: tyrosine-type recombinase/integrase [Acidimicrobiales bacterium]
MSREPKGTGTIVQIGNKFMVKVPVGSYPNGLTRYRSKTCQTKTEAKRLRSQLIIERDAGKLMANPEQRLEKFATHLLLQQEGGIAERTADGYIRNLQKHVFPKLGRRYMSDIKPVELEQLFNDLAMTLKTNTINHVRTALSKVFSEAERLEVVANNPVRRTRKMRSRADETLHRYPPLSSLEARNFIQAADGLWLQDYLKLAIGLGMRQGEILGLQWSDIDFDEGVLRVQRSISYDSILQRDGRTRYTLSVKPPKTRNSRRDLKLSEELMTMLSRRLGDQLTKEFVAPEYVFHSANGNPLTASSVRKQYRRLIDDHGLRFVRMHDLRHTFAHILLEADGGNLSGVSRTMGHSSIAVTLDVYGHSAGVAEQATAKMDAILYGEETGKSSAA